MGTINKAAAAGVIFFSVILAGFVGMKVDQTTIALLGGAFIGLVVAIPTTALIMVIGLRKPSAPTQPPVYHYHDQRPAQPAFPQYQSQPPMLQEQNGWRVVNPNQQTEYRLPALTRRFYTIGNGGEVKEIEPPRNGEDF